MYKVLKIRDKVKVHPKMFDRDTEEAVRDSLDKQWGGTIDKSFGVALSVTNVSNIGEGKILPGDGSIQFPVEFEMLTYTPDLYEVVKGDIIDVTEFGVFVRVGPVDGMVHVSQLMNDFVSYDEKNTMFVGRESKRTLKVGDTVKARIISVSMGFKQYKIGLTTRQPGLGNVEWKPVKEGARADGGEKRAGGKKASSGKKERKKIMDA
jgi:DNA-directed RNA polymerase subunit E'